ncbi:MAG: prolipoprotein diacylglyceryl transferase [Planctomycetota bacterium]|jgi:phosphatidylglycerol:prolipoprotein diacylglycerol transferase
MTWLAESYVYGLDPFAVRFSGNFGIRWYGLAYALGFLLGWVVLRHFARTKRTPLVDKGVGDLMTWLIVGVLVGGRVGWAVYYQGGQPFLDFRSTFPYWGLLDIMGGGMSAHGGLTGVILAVILYGSRHTLPSLHILDMLTLAALPGLFLGRLANFVNGELWGEPLAAEMQSNRVDGPPGEPPWWSIKYPAEITDTVQGYTWVTSDGSPVDAVAAGKLAQLEPLRSVFPGNTSFLPQVIEAAEDGNEAVLATLEPMLTAFYPSQLIQALTDGPLLLAILLIVWLRPRKPGIVGCWFMMGYGGLRFLTEIFRQADADVDRLLGLSRGQVLSVLMFAVGAVLLIPLSRRAGPKFDGPFGRTDQGRAAVDHWHAAASAASEADAT